MCVLGVRNLHNHTPPDIRDSFPRLADGCQNREENANFWDVKSQKLLIKKKKVYINII